MANAENEKSDFIIGDNVKLILGETVYTIIGFVTKDNLHLKENQSFFLGDVKCTHKKSKTVFNFPAKALVKV